MNKSIMTSTWENRPTRSLLNTSKSLKINGIYYIFNVNIWNINIPMDAV